MTNMMYGTTLVLYCPNAGNIFSEKKDHFSSLVLKRTKSLIKDLYGSTAESIQALPFPGLTGVLPPAYPKPLACTGSCASQSTLLANGLKRVANKRQEGWKGGAL